MLYTSPIARALSAGARKVGGDAYMLPSFGAELLHNTSKRITLCRTQRLVAFVEQCSDRRGARPAEESAQQVLHGRSLCHATRSGWQIDVPRTVLRMTELALRLQDTQERADRRGMRRILELVANLA